MSKRFVMLLLLTAGMVSGNALAQSLVEMDPGSVSDGNVYLMDNVTDSVPDVSANSNDGNLIGEPQTVVGLNGEALQFDGVDDGVHLPDADTINLSTHQNHTVIAVFNCADVSKSEKQVVYEEGGTTRGLAIYVHEGLVYAGGWNLSDYTPEWAGTHISAPIGSGEWHVVCAVLRNGTAAQEDDKFEMWMDGELIGKGPGGQLNSRSNDNAIGYHNSQVQFHDGSVSSTGSYYEGIVDEVWILNVALSEAELADIALSRTLARDPVPADEAVDVLRDGVLAWTPGEFAQTHDVYLGTAFDDVNNASRDNPMDVLISQGQADATFDPGQLEFGQMYYWRVDEVNGAPDNTIFKGETWSFEVEPFAIPIQNIVATASSSDVGVGPENTINGSGLDENDLHSITSEDMWVSDAAAALPATLTYQFDRAYKLHEMLVWNYNVQFETLLGYGFKDVTVEYTEDGTDWIVLGDFEFAQGPSAPAYAANTAIDFGGIAVTGVQLTANSNWGGAFPQTGLSEIRFLSIPVVAREPQPADGQTDVAADSMLAWRAGREAATHEVSLATDPNALASIGSSADNALDPGPLDLATTYYWQVAEVNEAETPTTWTGGVWSFSTVEFIVVDDFEAYDNDENLIFEVWIDGFTNETGSTVGYFEAPFAEQTTVHGGGQSMPLFYDNTGGLTTSEADFALDGSQNWSLSDIQSLSLFVYGDPGNSGGLLYLKIDDTKVAYAGPTDVLQRSQWVPWTIDLAATGASLANVTTLTIGIEGAGASGGIFVDDIRLYPYAVELIEPTLPPEDDPNLMAYYEFEGNADDSTGNYPGQVMGAPGYDAGHVGQAIVLDGIVDYVVHPFDQEEVWPACSVSLWARTDMIVQDQYSALFNNNSSTADFQIDTDGSDPGYYRYWGTTGGFFGPVTSEWVHLAVSCDGVTTDIYYNGLFVETLNVADTRFGQIGVGINRAGDNWYGGLIDEVRVYNRALADAEVAALAGLAEPIARPF